MSLLISTDFNRTTRTNGPASTAAVVLAALFAFITPVQAFDHCGEVDQTYAEIFDLLSPMDGDSSDAAVETCEQEMEAARDLMLKASEQAADCGCEPLATGLLSMIEGTKRPEYECWNHRQGLRGNVQHGVGDAYEAC